MTERTLSATDVKNRFGRVLREISKSGGPIVVERGGKPVAVILSVDEYRRSQGGSRLEASEEQMAASSFGMWLSRSDIGDDWLTTGRNRWESQWFVSLRSSS